MIKAVIFDMDGVLLDSEPFWQDALIQVFTRMGRPFTRAMAEETMGIRIDEVLAFRYAQQPWTGKSITEVMEEVLHEVSRLIREKGKLKAGVLEIFAFFEEKGLPMALASSSHLRIIRSVIETLELEDKFRLFRSAEKEAYGKPHPAIYLRTAEDLGMPAQQCLAIEDSLNGLIAAKAARMKTLMVPDPHLRHDPRLSLADLCLTSLTEWKPKHWEQLLG